MPRSPENLQDRKSLDAYRAAWQATMKLLAAGQSFSGHERNCVFMNQANPDARPTLRFTNASAVTGLDFDDDGRALGVVDWDLDGDLDLWLANRTGPRLRMMRNETRNGSSDSDHRFIAFYLQGTKSNRDAIGARVELHREGRPIQIQTLNAGDAYLSQSSKWLHFGLGSDPDRITKVIVRWPSGLVDEHRDIQVDQRYTIVESGDMTAWTTRQTAALAIQSSEPPAFEPPATSRTVLSNRLPLPLLDYASLSNQPSHASNSAPNHLAANQRPLLVVFWASWCAPCLVELQAIAENAAAWRELGIDMVALSLDGFDVERTTTAADAHRTLEQMRFPFASGLATQTLLDKLALTQKMVFDRQIPLSIPSSLLVDRDNQLAAIYQGPISFDQIRGDCQSLEVPMEARRDQAVPFSGRWNSSPRILMLRAVAGYFQEQGYTDDYARYLELDTQWMQQQRERFRSATDREAFDTQLAATHFNLGLALSNAGQTSRAIDHFRQAIEVKPDHSEARINLGTLLARTNDQAGALEQFRYAVEHAPSSVVARTNLALSLAGQGEFNEALPHFKFVSEKSPASVAILSQYARALLETQQFLVAVPRFQEALQLSPNDRRSLMCLAWLRATSPDEQVHGGGEAVALAKRLVAVTQEKDPVAWDILAASHAASGNFDAAISAANRALQTLGSRNRSLQTAIRDHLDHFEQRQRVIDADGKYP